MSLSATDYLLWAVCSLLLVMVCGALLKRRLTREFPVFFAYVAYHVLRAVLFAVYLLHWQRRMSHADYFYAYWIAEMVSIVLGFAVIREIYGKVFENYEALRRFGGIVFAGAAVVLLLVAVVAAASAPGADSPGIVRAVLLLQRSVRVLQCGMLALVFLLLLYFGLPWRNPVFGIALGFGLFASIELVAVAVRSQVGAGAATLYSQVRSGAYACGVMIWLSYLLAPRAAPHGIVLRNDLEKWNQVVLDILER
jgi:hypothetical protein